MTFRPGSARFPGALARAGALGFAAVLLFASSAGRAETREESSSADEPIVVDRAIVRFSAPEGGGRERPYFIYQRELAFEARLVALADSSHRRKSIAFRRHHVQQALERHVAETLLAALTIDPAPEEEQVAAQIDAARKMIVDEVGGERRFLHAARAEGMGSLEVRRYFRRRAMASLYLHAMVAPMLSPTTLELRRVHRRGEGPLAHEPFDKAEPALRRWYIARSLRAAVETYYQNARARVRLAFLE
jgi:hypothetical protein